METNKPYYIKELFTKEINDAIYCGIIFKRSYFAIGGNYNIYILDLTKKFEIIIEIKDAHKDKVSQLLEAPDGRLISTSFDGMVKLWKIDPALKVYYESNNYSENLLLKVPGANNYWIHGGIILGTYFFAICEIYKEKPLLRGGNGAGGGIGMSGFPKKFKCELNFNENKLKKSFKIIFKIKIFNIKTIKLKKY